MKAPVTKSKGNTPELRDQHFAIWMKGVDRWLVFNAGVTHEDMTDFNYRGAFDRGQSSVAAAKTAYRRAMQDY